jgi:hypothetical protein
MKPKEIYLLNILMDNIHIFAEYSSEDYEYRFDKST